MLKILLADDHPIIRTGTKYLLKDHLEHCQIFEAGNGDQMIDTVKKNDIDIILMDLNMPDTDSQRTFQTIMAIRPGTSIIIFSMNKEEIFGSMYLKMGAMGYLKKGCEDREIIKAIKCVADGNVYMTREMQSFYLGKTKEVVENPFACLTKKETEVLRHLSKGESIVNICKIMNLAGSTVGTHKAKIFEKLKVTNLFDLKSMTELYLL